MNTKLCLKCNTEKPIENFYTKKKNNKSYFSSPCKECINKSTKIYREKNKEKIAEYFSKNREILNQKKKLKRQSPEEKEKMLAYNRKYRKENREKWKQAKREKHQKNKKNPFYLITNRLRNRIRKVVKNNSKSASALELLGCSPEEFKNYLINKFTADMTWEDFMNGKIHIDHIIPCSSFNLLNPEEQKKCFHYTNLQPLWEKDNLKKGNKF